MQTSPSERNLHDQKEKVEDQKEKLTEAVKGGINVQCGTKVAQGKSKETSSHDKRLGSCLACSGTLSCAQDTENVEPQKLCGCHKNLKDEKANKINQFIKISGN